MKTIHLKRCGWGLALAVWLTAFSGNGSGAAELPTREDGRLIPMFHSDRVWNAVATTTDGRVFVGFPSADGPGVQLAELDSTGNAKPYPDGEWNRPNPRHDPDGLFVHVNALRIGPDGRLWVVDAGAAGIGKAAVPGGARIFRIDLARNAIDRVYPLGAALKEKSYIDDIRFNGDRAYLTDAGEAGLVVLDRRTGTVRRVLDGDPSATDLRPMRADGKVLRTETGKELRAQADQIEVSPDGRWLYYQPCSGPLARIGTRWLDDAEASPAEVSSHVEAWLDTPTSGGTAIDEAGNLYLSDPNRRRILKITPEKRVTVLIADPRLIWSDAMWIDRKGFLWIPATQQNLTPGFNDGKQAVDYPVWIYKMEIGKGPARNDHA